MVRHFLQIVRLNPHVLLFQSKIDSYKGKVTQLTRENTQRLDTFTVLLQEKKELEQMLNSRQKSLVSILIMSVVIKQFKRQSWNLEALWYLTFHEKLPKLHKLITPLLLKACSQECPGSLSFSQNFGFQISESFRVKWQDFFTFVPNLLFTVFTANSITAY